MDKNKNLFQKNALSRVAAYCDAPLFVWRGREGFDLVNRQSSFLVLIK
jgi:hypothetical protein